MFEVTVKERPVLFSGPMVKAILEGRKVQTRRIINTQEFPDIYEFRPWVIDGVQQWTPNRLPLWLSIEPDGVCRSWAGKYGKVGDRLWVRETWAKTTCKPDGQAEWHYVYKADDGKGLCPRCQEERYWKPSIHMPREASRITLEITDIRVERVQDISEEDCLKEGVIPATKDGKLWKYGLREWAWANWPVDSRKAFQILWDSINGKRPGCDWASNPFVWVIEFKRVEKPAG